MNHTAKSERRIAAAFLRRMSLEYTVAAELEDQDATLTAAAGVLRMAAELIESGKHLAMAGEVSI